MTSELPIELELRKLGLNEKEVKIYLVGLELGPDSIKNIAQKVKIPRPTVYEIIKKLEEKKLFVETKKDKKRLFVAQSPTQILQLLKIQKREIEEKEREFVRIIATLETKYSKEKEGFKVFKGKEGIKSLEEILSFLTSPEIFVINLRPRFELIFQKIQKRLGKINVKKIDAKTIEGTLIISDKVFFFPFKKNEGFLFENPLLIDLFKSLFSTLH